MGDIKIIRAARINEEEKKRKLGTAQAAIGLHERAKQNIKWVIDVRVPGQLSLVSPIPVAFCFVNSVVARSGEGTRVRRAMMAEGGGARERGCVTVFTPAPRGFPQRPRQLHEDQRRWQYQSRKCSVAAEGGRARAA